MRVTRLEIALGVAVALLWLWAVVWVHGLGALRGPLARPEHSAMAGILDELPPPALGLRRAGPPVQP